MKKLFLSLIILIFIWLIFRPTKTSKVDDYEVYANQIIGSTCDVLCKKFHFYLGAEGGSMPNFIDKFHLSFDIVEPASVERARELAVYCVETLIEETHKNTAARPYIVSYPFPYAHAEISVGFVHVTGHRYKNNGLQFVDQRNGLLRYWKNLDGSNTKSEIFLKEPYLEAYKKVMGHERPHSLNAGVLKINPFSFRDYETNTNHYVEFHHLPNHALVIKEEEL